jgi:hypothetical protein
MQVKRKYQATPSLIHKRSVSYDLKGIVAFMFVKALPYIAALVLIGHKSGW